MPAIQVQDLPVEIVLKIFQAVLGPRTGKRGGIGDLRRRQYPILLTHICRDWRTHALAFPFLWTDIQIHGNSELFLSFFERSHPLPIDLTVRIGRFRSQSLSISPSRTLREKLKSLDQSHLLRMRSIEILDASRLSICEVLTVMDGMALPNLQSLNLRSTLSPDTAHDHHTPFLTHATSIQSTTTSSACMSCIPGRQSITTLKLMTLPSGFDGTALRNLIESTPLLETLFLGDAQNGWVDENFPESEPPIINAPNLKTLVVTPQAVVSRVPWSVDLGRQSCAPLCHCTLRNLVADNLEHLEVSGASVGAALTHLVPSMNLRVQNKGVPPLRLILNRIGDAKPLRDIPRHLFLHITPLTMETPSTYSFTKEFLGAVLYFPGCGDSTDAFDASGEYCRVPGADSAFGPCRSKEGPRRPFLDPPPIQQLFEDDDEYESYWQQSLFGSMSHSWHRVHRHLAGVHTLSDSDSDDIDNLYGLQEDDEDEDEDEHESDHRWEHWDSEEGGGDLNSEYGDDSDGFRETGDTADPVPFEPEGEESQYPQGNIEEGHPSFEECLQTGMIYFDEDDPGYHETSVDGVEDYDEGFGDVVQTGVLYLEEAGHYLGEYDSHHEEEIVPEAEESHFAPYDLDFDVHGYDLDGDQEVVQQPDDDVVYSEDVEYFSDGGYAAYESPDLGLDDDTGGYSDDSYDGGGNGDYSDWY